MAHQLEYPENTGHADQPHDLPGLAHNVELGQVVEHEREQVGEDGEQVHQVEGLDKEEELAGRAAETHHVFDGEEHRRERVYPHDGLDRDAQVVLLLRNRPVALLEVGGRRTGAAVKGASAVLVLE